MMALAVETHAASPSLIPNTGCIDDDGNVVTCPPAVGPAATSISCDFSTGLFSSTCIPGYIAYLLKTIFQLTGAIFLLMIIIGGYQYTIGKASGGGGDEGKARVRFAIIGFLITAMSFYIVDFILNALIP